MNSPFKFLDSYTREDRAIFFGRDQEITDLYRRIFESKMLLVYGVSGTGKSSLINCGLASRFDDSDWLPVNVRRGSNIVDSLNEAFNKQAIKPFRKNLTVAEKLQSIYLDHFKPVYLIFDQFEELFIFGTQEEKTGFIKLIKAIVDSETQCRIIFVIREEFLAGITEFEYDLPEIFSNRFRVEKMKRANAISAIEGPCKVYNIVTEEGFSEELIDKLCPTGNEIELTFLQIYLDRIFRLTINEKPETGNITFSKELLTRAGSVSDLLGQFLDEQIREMEDPETGMSVLKTFISVQGTKRQMNECQILDSLGAFGTDIPEPVLLKYLTKFVDLRILRERDEAGHFELRHDSLAAKIYEKFTAIEKDIIEVRQFIDSAFSTFEKRGKLLTDEDLKYIAPYEGKLFLNKTTELFINRSKNELAKSRKRKRVFATAAALVLFVILSGFSIWALTERRKAFKERETADIQKDNALSANEKALKAQAEALREKNRALENEKVALKAREEAEIAERKAIKSEGEALIERNRAIENKNISIQAKKEAEDAKESALASEEMALKLKGIADLNYLKTKANSFNYLSQKVAETDPTVALRLAEYAVHIDSTNPDIVENMNRIYFDNLFYRIVSWHIDYINSIAFSPDGKNILTGAGDKTAILWDLQGNIIREFKGHLSYIKSVAFSPDGKTILTGSGDSTARLWNLQGNVLQVFKGHRKKISSVAFSPDGKSILTSSDNTVYHWDLNGNVLHEFKRGLWSEYSPVCFSPNGKFIVTSAFFSGDKAYIWGLDGNLIKVLKGRLIYSITSLAVSPDSRYVLTSDNFTARLWDLKGNEIQVFEGHESQILSVAFSPDGKFILTGSLDNTARVWDLNGHELYRIKGHQRGITSAIFSPDGNNILTGSQDMTARLWNIEGKVLGVFSEEKIPITSVAFSPDGQKILTSQIRAMLWDLQGNRIQAFHGLFQINSVAFSPDGKSILAGCNGPLVRLWDIEGNLIREMEVGGWASSVAFSHDGKRILTGSSDGFARLWDLQGKILNPGIGHSGTITSAAISPDGQRILTSSKNNAAYLWDPYGNRLNILSGHSRNVNSVSFSPDNKYMLTGSDDNTARLWNLQGNLVQEYIGHEKSVTSVVFSPEGDRILTGSSDCTARLWDLKGNIIQIFKGHEKFISSVAFSPGGKSILTGSGDNTARLWGIKKSLKEFQKENNYEELTIEQKIKYGIIESVDNQNDGNKK